MTDFSNITHADLDWDLLWQNAQRKKGWASKGAKEWDKKSTSFATRNKTSPYVSKVLKQLPLEPSMTVLDVGSGPGTLALPIAEQVSAVTAIDFSPNMLQILNSSAAEKGLTNITTIECAWEDDWEQKGITTYDLAIASRSMGVENLTQAIEKLNRHTTKYVFIADRISPTPFDPLAFHAVDRSFESGPDYIYTLNVLYSMGIHPNVTVLKLDKDMYFADIELAMESYTWMLKGLTGPEEEQLRLYLEEKARPAADGGLVISREMPPQWALIWWQKA
jgi:SAM-dependent methyltransferase